MQDGTESVLSSQKEAAFSDRGQQIAHLVESLTQSATRSQQDVTALLSKEAATSTPLFTKTTSFWITNQVFIEGATFELVEQLAQILSIVEIREESVLELPKALATGSSDGDQKNSSSPAFVTNPSAWGVQKVQAPELWAKGITGQNIVVGVIDSGVRGTHESLRGNFLGQYGWLDPERHAAAPYDEDGHGTHVAGSAVGQNGIGVAPGAKWSACKSCRATVCLESETIACTQFMLCPTDTDGNNPDCSKAPHVINNSWSVGIGGNTRYAAIIAAWRQAGIIPVFASGNVSPNCGTVKSPGDDPNVIAVGATNADDSLLFYSGTGPTLTGLLKPEVTAPGGDVYSAGITGDDAYRITSGTSMASPHVAGAIALLLNANPSLTYDQVLAALQSTTDTSTLISSGRTCGGTPDKVFPNNIFGHGRVNVLKAAGL
uniref:subtilisin n=1 Tax=Globisporangium ultimum (strain ATCC 200006 / CBS 805.95 / DAOM BR144) TaxID=431595 RepID=K3W9G0_GLOUD